MKRIELKESQKDTIKILKEIDAICSDLHLTYWVMYGTLIGTVRHQGFIPWDDDVDIAMPRSDYEKLLQYFSNNDNNIDGLYIDNPKTNNQCFFYISRLCDKEHSLIFDDRRYTSGLFIDIYPFDGMGQDNDKKYWEDARAKTKYLRKMLDSTGTTKIFNGKNIATKFLNVPLILKARKIGNRVPFEEIDKLTKAFSWEESKYVGLPIADGELIFFKKDWFSETLYLPFEDITVPVPVGYDKILKDIYGNYMQLPPEKDRNPHHGYITYRK